MSKPDSETIRLRVAQAKADREQRERRRKSNIQTLRNAGEDFRLSRDGYTCVLRGPAGAIRFWPSSGRWVYNRGRFWGGANSLIAWMRAGCPMTNPAGTSWREN